MDKIAKELLETIKYIPKEEKNSRWYREYLDRINQDLKNNLF